MTELMVWTDASANAEQWGELATAGEIQLLDESGNVLLDELGGELVIAGLTPWSDAADAPETWADV